MDELHYDKQADIFAELEEDYFGRMLAAEVKYKRMFGKEPLPFPGISDKKYTLLLEKCIAERKSINFYTARDEEEDYSIFDRQSEKWL